MDTSNPALAKYEVDRALNGDIILSFKIYGNVTVNYPTRSGNTETVELSFTKESSINKSVTYDHTNTYSLDSTSKDIVIEFKAIDNAGTNRPKKPKVLIED